MLWTTSGQNCNALKNEIKIFNLIFFWIFLYAEYCDHLFTTFLYNWECIKNIQITDENENKSVTLMLKKKKTKNNGCWRDTLKKIKMTLIKNGWEGYSGRL